MRKTMSRIQIILLWIIFGLFIILSLCAMPSFSSIFSAVAAFLILPVKKWQGFISKYLNTKIKIIGVIITAVLMFITFPSSNIQTNENDTHGATGEDDSISEITNIVSTDTYIESTNYQNADSMIDLTDDPIDEPTDDPIDGPTDDPIDEPTNDPIDEPTDDPIDEPTKESVIENPHIHSFETATCTKAKTCSCGATEGSPLGHDWENATCTVPKKCNRCGTTEGNVSDHKWNNATCTSPKTCSVCGVTAGNANGHKWKDATYGSPKRCTACDATEGSPLSKPGGENYHGHVYTGGESSKKYHYEAECAGKYSHEITWDEVDRRGLGPCGTCVLK